MSEYSPYIAGLTRSEAIHYTNNLDLPWDEKERMLKAAQRQPVSRRNLERAERMRKERESRVGERIAVLVDYLKEHPGATYKELKEMLHCGSGQYQLAISTAVKSGAIRREQYASQRASRYFVEER